jgi:3-methyladenine DNA glycosylase AlkD
MKNLHNADEVIANLKKLANKEKAGVLMRFFKTGKGEYAEGDVFWGINVPTIRKIAGSASKIEINQVQKLIQDPVHEVRLCGLLILVIKFKNSGPDLQKEIFDIYLKNRKYINNWDLVDVTAPNIIGEFLLNQDRTILYDLASSDNLWDKRISMISTFAFIRKNDFIDAIEISRLLMFDEHDLIHKATGWMLREIYKRDKEPVLKILDEFAYTMPRTMLRYCIEKMDEPLRLHYLHLKDKNNKLK